MTNMSFQAMMWAIVQHVKNSGEKLVLLMLANHCNGHTGLCSPSHKKLAVECCMKPEELAQTLLKLEENGHLEIIRRQRENGTLLPNYYRLELPVVEEIAPARVIPCPHKQILALWAKYLPQLSQPRIWEGARAQALKTRWIQASKKSTWSPDGYTDLAGGLKFWEKLFSYIANETMLSTGFEYRDGHTWMPDLQWVCTANNFAKILDRKYQKDAPKDAPVYEKCAALKKLDDDKTKVVPMPENVRKQIESIIKK